MRTFTRVILFTLLLTGVFVSSAKADSGPANWLYTYVGDKFTYATGVYEQGDRVIGSFLLSGSFVPACAFQQCGAYNENVTSGVLGYIFTDGHQILTQRNSTGTFYVGLNGPNGFFPLNPIAPNGGEIPGLRNDWDISITTPTSFINTGDVDGDYGTSASIGDSIAQILSFNDNLYPGGPGTWTVRRVPVPEGGTTGLFLFVGLAGLTIFTRFSGLKSLTRGL